MAAHQELRIRGVDRSSIMRAVLRFVSHLVPLEIAMEKAGHRVMQTIPAYALGFSSNIPKLLAEIARKVRPVDPERSWINPFTDFEEASREIVHHYRNVAEKVDFDGILLEKWFLDSIISAADVHFQLLSNPPAGAEPYLATVDNRLQWYIYAPTYVFAKGKSYSPRHAADVCGALAALTIKLLTIGREKSAEACVESLDAIARQAFSASNDSSWHAADSFIHMEEIARAADAIGFPNIASAARSAMRDPKGMLDAARPEYEHAIETRISQLDRRLVESRRTRGYGIHGDPVDLLSKILADADP